MGRMLEYLVRGKQQTSESTETFRSTESAADCEAQQDDCPYIEVGDPDKKIVGSPSVLSSPHPGQMGVPHPPRSQFTPPATEPENEEPEQVSQTVHFERWIRPSPDTCPIALDIVAYHHPADTVSRQYSRLLDQVWRDKDVPASILFCGTRLDTAAVTVMLNTAVSCCFHHHRRVVVVGADFAHPAIRSKLGLAGEKGLAEVIGGSISLEDVVQKTAVPHMHAIPEGDDGKTHAEVAKAASWILDWLRERFHLVMIAGPCVNVGDDAASWMPHTDGVLLVGGPTPDQSELTRVSETIDRAGGTLQGFIHTNIEM